MVILKKLETALGKINSRRSSSSLLGLPLSSLQPLSFFGPRPSLRLPLWPKRCACTVGQADTIDQLGKYKAEKILKGSLDSIPSLSPSVNIFLKVKVMGSNPGYLLKSFLLYQFCSSQAFEQNL